MGDLDITTPQPPVALRIGAALSTQNHLGAWLREQRWFADKHRDIVATSIEGVAPLGGDPAGFWAVLEVTFHDGAARYALPLKLGPTGTAAAPLVHLPEGDVTDATTDATVAIRPLELLATRAHLPCGAGQLVFEPYGALDAIVDRARTEPIAAGGLEQTNTAIRYGSVLLLKLFRKLQEGSNPDEEIGRFLGEVGFASVPAPLGAIHYRSATGEETLAGFAQAFVPNDGDGWHWLLDQVRSLLQTGLPGQQRLIAPIAALGRTTAALHVALASDPATPAFAPEAATVDEIAELWRAADAHLTETLTLLRDRHQGGAIADLKLVVRLIGAESALRRTLIGFADEAGLARIRVHGDYHLGQTLRGADGGWTIIDFEGEPARPLAERRRKTSPLKDVAGMLRSFSYLKGALLQDARRGSDEDALSHWESATRSAFLTAYRATVGAAATLLVPADDAAFARALAAWELDKALYEVRYELANRPDWLPIPLAALASFTAAN